MIEQRVALFGSLIEAVRKKPEKETTFTGGERVALLAESVRESGIPGVEIAAFDWRYFDARAVSLCGAHYVGRTLCPALSLECSRARAPAPVDTLARASCCLHSR